MVFAIIPGEILVRGRFKAKLVRKDKDLDLWNDPVLVCGLRHRGMDGFTKPEQRSLVPRGGDPVSILQLHPSRNRVPGSDGSDPWEKSGWVGSHMNDQNPDLMARWCEACQCLQSEKKMELGAVKANRRNCVSDVEFDGSGLHRQHSAERLLKSLQYSRTHHQASVTSLSRQHSMQ
ncbi:hypothetical protein Q5P01_002135 [Channa striata]|uniref:Uncharacterized protein n=1 Tax=Channa striata TaxID=64152 RepID=A0AA88NPI8_CHASR|nr:hypothetical protein Q5P01_002135 [Channa striata]